jgi:hypothetical protein
LYIIVWFTMGIGDVDYTASAYCSGTAVFAFNSSNVANIVENLN